MTASRSRDDRRQARPPGGLTRPGDTNGYLVGVALEAKLFGRLRLLTVEAVVDLTEGVAPIETDGTLLRPAPDRRSQALALLRDADRALGAASSRW